MGTPRRDCNVGRGVEGQRSSPVGRSIPSIPGVNPSLPRSAGAAPGVHSRICVAPPPTSLGFKHASCLVSIFNLTALLVISNTAIAVEGNKSANPQRMKENHRRWIWLLVFSMPDVFKFLLRRYRIPSGILWFPEISFQDLFSESSSLWQNSKLLFLNLSLVVSFLTSRLVYTSSFSQKKW